MITDRTAVKTYTGVYNAMEGNEDHWWGHINGVPGACLHQAMVIKGSISENGKKNWLIEF